MPYIDPSNRTIYDENIQKLAENLKAITKSGKECGELNYIITSLIKQVYKDRYCYSVHNEIVGMLECCKQEWYRRFSAPYEDLAILRNGDVKP